jgi:hypothetical protein
MEKKKVFDAASTLLSSYCDALRTMGRLTTADMVAVLSVELTNTLRQDTRLSRRERADIIDCLATALREAMPPDITECGRMTPCGSAHCQCQRSEQ